MVSKAGLFSSMLQMGKANCLKKGRGSRTQGLNGRAETRLTARALASLSPQAAQGGIVNHEGCP